MCGIIGSVGQSKHPDLSYILLTNLLIETKTRGTDATGFCCIDKYNKIKLYYGHQMDSLSKTPLQGGN